MPTRGGAAAEFTRRRFGQQTRLQEFDVTVGVTPVQLVQNNADRLGLTLQNDGAATVTVAGRGNVVAGTGLLMTSGGGVVGYDVFNDGEAVTYEQWGVSTGAGNVVHVVEVLAVGYVTPITAPPTA